MNKASLSFRHVETMPVVHCSECHITFGVCMEIVSNTEDGEEEHEGIWSVPASFCPFCGEKANV